ncbi:hypothetical protein A2U01_0084147, partial [Trifolium medium]|nr:hypothetical protein [Trifolium medium]
PIGNVDAAFWENKVGIEMWLCDHDGKVKSLGYSSNKMDSGAGYGQRYFRA